VRVFVQIRFGMPVALRVAPSSGIVGLQEPISMAMESDDVPGWAGSTRDDGMGVAIALGGTWFVKPSDERAAITACPCCQVLFPTARAAKVAANIIYPAVTIVP
jgi:hypothetical protein